MLFRSVGKHLDALIIFDKILSSNENVNVIYAKARSKAAIGNVDESLEFLKKAIKKDPKAVKNWIKSEKIFQSIHDERIEKIIK